MPTPRAAFPLLVFSILHFTTAASAGPDTTACRTSNGASGASEREVIIERPELKGFSVGRRCEQTLGAPPRVAIIVSVPTAADRGAEQKLNEEGGAAWYIHALSRGKAFLHDESPIVLLGRTESLYRMTGDFSRFSPALEDAEILTARVRLGAHNVAFWAVYPRAEARTWRMAVRRHFQSVGVTILEPSAAGKDG